MKNISSRKIILGGPLQIYCSIYSALYLRFIYEASFVRISTYKDSKEQSFQRKKKSLSHNVQAVF